MDHKDYRLAAIMFTDIVGFSRMMEQDEAGTLTLLEYHNTIIRKFVQEHNGTVIKTIGDAFMADFPNTINATQCAIKIQNELSQYNQENPEKKLVLRIGIHLGDIYFYENDALGEGINIASRLQSLCNPGRICISQDVYNIVSNKIGDTKIREMGEVRLKNISREIRAYEIVTQGNGIDPEKITHDTEKTNNSTKNPRPSGPLSGPAVDSEGKIDVHVLKSLILSEVKRTGQRLTAQHVTSWYPTKPDGLDDALDALKERGFLSSGTNSSIGGNREYTQSRPTPIREESFDKGLQEFKEATIEIGRELRKAFIGADSWLKSVNQPNALTIPEKRGDGSDEGKDKRAEKQWDKILDLSLPSPDDEQIIIREYRKQTEQSTKKMNRALTSHVGTYVGVNGFLFSIYALTMFGGFPWFLIPALAWGIGLSSQWSAVKRRKRENQEIASLPGLTKQQLRSLRSLHKNRNKWQGKAIGAGATSVFLFVLNMITSPMVPWSLIPISIMTLGSFATYPSYKEKEQECLIELKKQGVPTAVLSSGKERKALLGYIGNLSQEASPMEIEAARLRGVILSQIKHSKTKEPLGSDFPELLDDYVKQISELSGKIENIHRIMEEIPRKSLENDLLTLTKQKNASSDPMLQAEYQRGIDQITRQQKSFQELESQEKVISLRLANAMNSLRQIQLELVRMDSYTKDANELQREDLLSRTTRLDGYVEDLRAGYLALESSDFAELEKYND